MTEEIMNAEAWGGDVPRQEISLEQMDSLAARIKAAREEYDAQKKLASEAHGHLEILENEMVALLKASGRKSYAAPGIGSVGYREKEQYTVPKDLDAKRALFSYISDKYGRDVLASMLSINHNTINSWANKETETGEVQQIPGLDQPTMIETFYFTKEK